MLKLMNNCLISPIKLNKTLLLKKRKYDLEQKLNKLKKINKPLDRKLDKLNNKEINFGNSKEISYGKGIREVINRIENYCKKK